MAYDYRNTSVVNGNVHILKLRTPIGAGGTGNYTDLTNKPSINDVELIGELTLVDLGIQPAGNYPDTPLTAVDIDIITGGASCEESFFAILEMSNEIILDDDISLTSQVVIDKNFTIDLSGQAISSLIDMPLFLVDGGYLTIRGTGTINTANVIGSAINGGRIIIENGTLISGDVGFETAGRNARVIFNGGSLTAAKGGIGIYSGSDIIFNKGQISTTDGPAIFSISEGNIIRFNGGKLISNVRTEGYESVGVYLTNRGMFIMNGGDIIANNGAGLLMRGGTAVISNGTITATGEPGITGWIGDEDTLMSKSAIIYHESANYPGKEGMNLAVAGGVITGVDHSIEVLSNEATPNVTVSGGTLSPAFP